MQPEPVGLGRRAIAVTQARHWTSSSGAPQEHQKTVAPVGAGEVDIAVAIQVCGGYGNGIQPGGECWRCRERSRRVNTSLLQGDFDLRYRATSDLRTEDQVMRNVLSSGLVAAALGTALIVAGAFPASAQVARPQLGLATSNSDSNLLTLVRGGRVVGGGGRFAMAGGGRFADKRTAIQIVGLSRYGPRIGYSITTANSPIGRPT